ncbi:MAG: metallophosphoesterase family protein [Kiritimatiellae bacterium]|nr:metallophosphoesterase family protein [Kiritimatiellia bacterium]
MRYAFVSDIHGNLTAWNTVLQDMAVHRIDRIVCLGDVVGYGPQPAECLQSVYARVHSMVLGNHDAVVGGRMGAEQFNDRARRAIEWTRSRLGEAARRLFADLPMALKGPGFRCAHGDFTDPALFRYVFSPEDAAANFAATSEQLLFVGHTHEACFFVTGESGAVYKLPPQDFALEEGKRYLVNAGSVGSPRDGDLRACYVIYDEAKKSVWFHRVAFDVEAVRAAVRAAPGLEPDDVQILRFAATRETDPVRAAPDFSPGAEARASGSAAAGDVERRLALSNARLRRGNRLLAAGCALLAALAAAAGLAVWSLRDRGAAFPAREAAPLASSGPAAHAGRDGNLLPAVVPTSLSPLLCEPYRAVLSDARRQSFSLGGPANDRRPRLESAAVSAGTASFDSPPVACLEGERYEAIARVRFAGAEGADFAGSFRLSLVFEDATGAERTLLERDFSRTVVGLSEKDLPSAVRACPPAAGWLTARGSVKKEDKGVPAPGLLRVRLSGSFAGAVDVGALSLRRR